MGLHVHAYTRSPFDQAVADALIAFQKPSESDMPAAPLRIYRREFIDFKTSMFPEQDPLWGLSFH
jgi:hypothetical protein